MKIILFALGCLVGASLFISCQGKEEAANTDENWQPDMYQPSELVLVMRQMYEDNITLKDSIAKGIVPKEVPAKYHEILTATATNPSELDEVYYSLAKTYLANFETLTKSDSSNALTNYNTVVNTCIGCHQNYCMGPIPKIEKLLIK